MNRTQPLMDMRLHAPAPTRPDTRPLFQALRKGRLLPLVVCLLLSFGTTAAGQSLYQGSGTHPSPPPVPQYIVFAGDTIRFDRSDLYERMDRELIAFTYSHTNSLLMLKRSERIFHQVVPLLNLHGIPEDLKYLMAIESNLSPKALSTAGAAGLWQFMKGTAKEYGLVVTAEVDERYNIEKETVAACKFLRKAYSRYHDWMTVAASYNGGLGGISAKLSSQMESSAMDLYLVEETSRYMFRILVAKMFFENPALFGFDVKPSDYYPYYEPRKVVNVSGAVGDLAEFAKKHGVSYMQLKEANLWLRDTKLVNKEGHNYKIIIPGGQ